MPKKNPTTREIMEVVVGVKENTEEILEAIGVFSNRIDTRLEKVDVRLEKVDAGLEKLEHRMGALESSVKNYLEEMVK